MDKLRASFKCVAIPQPGDKVYKDECIFSYETPESENGLYVCMKTFLGLGKNLALQYSNQTGNNLFLHLRHIKTETPIEKETEPEKKIARLAIGVQGGFNTDTARKFTIEERHCVVLLPDFEIFPLPNPELPELIQQCVSGILKAESALHLAEVEAASASWDGEIRQVSKFADCLQQLDEGVKIPPSGWKCEKCDKTDNLWLNLTDGKILCGRRQADGSGGNNHAMEHYNETRHPLSVKLGTITPDGKADVYSYEEDDMVLDPNLVTHLAHFGINVSTMEKTEKTMVELEIEINQRAWEWSRLTESGTKLTPKFGPDFTGLKNLGNSCYLNSVMQVLMTIPTFIESFNQTEQTLVANCTNFSQAPEDFNIQMSKLANGLLSGNHSKPPLNNDALANSDIDSLQPGVSPVMFRTLVGKGHPEFSTKRQQDAMEFMEHVLKLVTRNSQAAVDCGYCFKFEVEDKFVCSDTNRVRYVVRDDLYLPLPVPLEEAVNKDEVNSFLERKAEAHSKNIPFIEEQVHSKIPFEVCLSKIIAPESITAFSSAVNRDVEMQKITRLKTFPNFLIIQLVKFGLSPDWQPVKYDVSIDMPDILDLSVLKSLSQQPEEELLPESTPQKSAAPVINEGVVQQLVEMGFPLEACRKAVHFSGNIGLEAATNWIMEHIDDPDFAAPMNSTPGSKDDFIPSEGGLAMIMSMGFTRDQARLSLKETDNNLERAADWIFSHQPQLDSLLAADHGSIGRSSEQPAMPKLPFSDGDPRYEMIAFISHMGTSIHVGHYICHIKKDNEWTIFNDNKVCKSENPPKDLGYIYIYRRITQ